MEREYIYLVFGQTGEHEDARDWVICAYRNENEADTHAKLAKERADAIFKETQGQYWKTREKTWTNDYDPEFVMDYTGNVYYVVKTELR